jgi:hypothetical protein
VEIEVAPNADIDVLVELPNCRREFVVWGPHDHVLGLLAHWVTGVGLSRFDLSL